MKRRFGFIVAAIMALTVVIGPASVSASGEGCTPGYWKNHLDSWTLTDYDPDDLFGATSANKPPIVTFNDAFPGKTLLQVLNTGGGGLYALGRHAVAALLNSQAVGYGLYDWAVIEGFNNAYPGTWADQNAMKDNFENYNTGPEGCPLN